MAGWNKPKKPFFFHRDIGICSSGSFRWSEDIKNRFVTLCLCFGNEQPSWGKQNQKKRMRERQKISRREVSCSWTCGRYRSARRHIHTSFTTLRTTPPSSTPNSQRQSRSEKHDRAGKGGETFVSGGMWRESYNSEMRFGRSKHRKSECLGLSPPGRGQITLVNVPLDYIGWSSSPRQMGMT